jgi:hypothetical protein
MFGFEIGQYTNKFQLLPIFEIEDLGFCDHCAVHHGWRFEVGWLLWFVSLDFTP